MSYNLDNIKIISGQLSISKKKAILLLELAKDTIKYLPESTFLDELNLHPRNDFTDDEIQLKNIRWCGEGSGRTYDFFENLVLKAIGGSAEIMEIWERGDTVETYTLKNGKKENLTRIH